ncbi:NAD-dependent epimerase/dehydratase family protein [Actinomadura rudentiformis]|uniref:NAD(P)-dependent oxidoreductase n=1 Tax=Actinomadura rudentiformis TaxID=359158 RepID=A0A6H9YU22_9ACTN|nr:NAD(P)-dependent oxidoreductase [Actinomadura rudentiformis]KAB2343274.1 NAD(P)-dependent oxidoreductase [Actinomadura rudentiformis]
MKVAVTGASGFVGGAVCRALADHGIETLAFGRRPEVAPGHLGGATYRSWDLTSGPLAAAPEVDAVVHCAGTVTDWGPAATFFATNLGGTRNALRTFPGARFVHVSTASVYDPYRPTVMATEDEAPVFRYLNAYGASKMAAERAVLSVMRGHGPAPWRRARPRREAIILRPHAVYGPGDTTLLPRVLSSVRGPVLPATGRGGNLVSLTSIGNLVEACLLAACGPTGTGVYNVTDAEPVTLRDALHEILAERGVHARPIFLPARAVRPIATAVEGAFLLARRPNPPRLTRYAVSHLAVERTLDITAARDALGYDPKPTSFAGAADW